MMLFLARKIEVGKKKKCKNCNNCCPDCTSPLNRIQRKKTDHFLHYITFQIFDFKRYICNDCGWEGLRWEERFSLK